MQNWITERHAATGAVARVLTIIVWKSADSRKAPLETAAFQQPLFVPGTKLHSEIAIIAPCAVCLGRIGSTGIATKHETNLVVLERMPRKRDGQLMPISKNFQCSSLFRKEAEAHNVQHA